MQIDGEREGSLQGIEPPVRGQRPKTDQRLVSFIDTHRVGGTGEIVQEAPGCVWEGG